MKRSLLALAALTAFTGVASAQSSVTLFGILDVAARNVKNGPAGSLSTLSTDGSVSSRLGIRGVEDLGGGLRAAFWLEGAVAVDVGGQKTAAIADPRVGVNGSGVAAIDWQRQAYVALLGTTWGQLRAGRDYTPTFYNHVAFDPFAFVGVGAQANLMGAAAGSPSTTLVRANNTITYLLPAMGGVYGQATVAAGEGVDANKYMGGRLGYAAGPMNVAVSYGRTATTLGDTKAFNIGGAYDLGFMRPLFQYHQYKYRANTQTNIVVGGTAPLGKGQILKFTYGKVSDWRSATQLALGFEQGLSRRTALYANYSRINNKGAATFRASNGGVSTAAQGITSTGYEAGVRHSF